MSTARQIRRGNIIVLPDAITEYRLEPRKKGNNRKITKGRQNNRPRYRIRTINGSYDLLDNGKVIYSSKNKTLIKEYLNVLNKKQ